MRSVSWLVFWGCAMVACIGPAAAQVPPSATEIQAYGSLHRAAVRGDLAQLGPLLKSGADVETRDGHGRTPLHVATHAGRRDAIRLLAQAGAKLDALDDDCYDAVTIAAVADDRATLALLLSLGASAAQTTSRYDGTALIAAAHLGHDKVVRQLIAAGAPLDHVNNLHWTALIESIVLGNGGPRHQRALALLADAGANPQLADRQGNTPFQLARARGYTAMVDKLNAAATR
jgi:ankyrin repeat protein